MDTSIFSNLHFHIFSSCVPCPPCLCFRQRVALSPRVSGGVARPKLQRYFFWHFFNTFRPNFKGSFCLSIKISTLFQAHQAKSHEAKSAKKGLKRSPDGHGHSAPSVSDFCLTKLSLNSPPKKQGHGNLVKF